MENRLDHKLVHELVHWMESLLAVWKDKGLVWQLVFQMGRE